MGIIEDTDLRYAYMARYDPFTRTGTAKSAALQAGEHHVGNYEHVTFETQYVSCLMMWHFIHTHTNPILRTFDQLLGTFVSNLRSKYKRNKADPEASSLTPEKIDKLNEIGFVWDALEQEWDTKFVSVVSEFYSYS